LALRLMAAVHRLVLTGQAPRLAGHYPSVGGRVGGEGAWDAFRETLVEQGQAVSRLLELPCQTNEVGRRAPLGFGFFEIASETGLPLRLLEVGASAGLNLRFERFRFGGGGASFGPADSPVSLVGLWREPPTRVPPSLEVWERLGCDP